MHKKIFQQCTLHFFDKQNFSFFSFLWRCFRQSTNRHLPMVQLSLDFFFRRFQTLLEGTIIRSAYFIANTLKVFYCLRFPSMQFLIFIKICFMCFYILKNSVIYKYFSYCKNAYFNFVLEDNIILISQIFDKNFNFSQWVVFVFKLLITCNKI